MVYDLCYDRFSEANRRTFAVFARDGIRIALEYRDADLAMVANNRGARGLICPVWYSMAIEGDDSNHYPDQAVVAVERYLFSSFDAGRAPFEGPGYATTLVYMAATAVSIHRRGGPNLLTNDRFERIAEYLLYEMVPGGGGLNPLNDAFEGKGTMTGVLPLIGGQRGLLAAWLAHRLDLHPDRTAEWLEIPADGRIFWLQGDLLLYFFLWWRDDAPERAPEKLGYPTSHWFPGRGVAESDSTVPRDRWFGETTAHNCIMMNGQIQRGTVPTPGWVEGRLLDFERTPSFVTSLGDASACIGPDHRIRRSLRRVVLVLSEPVRYLAVVDAVEVDGDPFAAQALWHTAAANTVSVEDAGSFTIADPGQRAGGAHRTIGAPAQDPFPSRKR